MSPRVATRAEKIDWIEKQFQELYLDAIPLLHASTKKGGKTGHYLSFVAMFGAIEVLASLYAGDSVVKHENGKRTKAFIKDFYKFDPRYKPEVMWNLRNSLSHTFACNSSIVLTHARPCDHFAVKDNRTWLNAETFCSDLIKASEAYFRACRTDLSGVGKLFEDACSAIGFVLTPVGTSPSAHISLSHEFYGTSSGYIVPSIR